MASTDLQLDSPGTLPKPGPVGRIVRLLFGLLCAWYVFSLIDLRGSLLGGDGHIRSIVWNGVLPALFLISYIINIGYSRAWRKRPAIVSVVAMAVIAGVGFLVHGRLETEILARSLWAWEVYAFGHLGLAFLLSGIIGTPGCEMRAFHDAYSRLTGTPTKEHRCPVGPLSPIDQWEAGR
jgi:hypothetical protein